MKPASKKVQPFSVAGISVRTINSDELNPVTARLPGLWGRFFTEGVAGQVPHSVPGSIYGVYSAYESDLTGPYTLTAGVQVTQPVTGGPFTSVDVQGGDYLVFEANGPMPLTLIQTWAAIWAYFQTNRQYTRAYTTDFEEYRGPDGVAIHIAIN